MPLGSTKLKLAVYRRINMTLMTRSNFPSQISSMFIGLDNFFDDLDLLAGFHEPKYPPFNLIREDADHYSVEMAVAGFAPEDISVTSKNGILTISAKSEKNDATKDRDYVYRGLSSRSFEQDFKLYEHVTVESAEFNNGVLKVKLERKLPEHLKEQTFPINITKQLKS